MRAPEEREELEKENKLSRRKGAPSSVLLSPGSESHGILGAVLRGRTQEACHVESHRFGTAQFPRVPLI